METWNSIFSDFTGNPLYSKIFDNVAVWLGGAVLVITGYILWNWKRSNLPPGPIGMPIFGYYFSFRRKPLETLAELAKRYGNVVGLYIGPKYVVFLNDWEAVKDGLSQKSTIDRPLTVFHKVPYKFGFGGANGAEWVETRRLAIKLMKDGIEKNQWEDLMEEELSDMIKHIKEQDGKPIEVRCFLSDSFTNNVISLLLGDRLEDGNPITTMVTRSVDFIMENFHSFQMINFSELLTVVLKMLGVEKLPSFTEETDEFITFVSNTVDSNRYDSKENKIDSFITRFQEEIDSRKKLKQKTYTSEDNLKGTLVTLMVGGNDTTRTTIVWALIAMADHPDKQKKVHEELDRVIGKDGSVRWSDRGKVPYTLAALLEAMRWKTTIPIPAWRKATEDTRIQGYHIPKGTYVVPNIMILHNDSRYWDKPDEYIPERFLLEGGQKVNMAAESYIPFSYGKRNCPGKFLALMDTMQYFSTLMQKFRVVPKEGHKVKYDAAFGLSYQAKNVEMCFIPR